MRKSQDGQSVFEYIIFLTAVIIVVLIFLATGGIVRRETESSLNKAVNTLEEMVNKINF